MRRTASKLPFSGSSTRRPYAPEPDEDREVSYSGGRAFLRETSRHDPDYTITSKEQSVLRQRRLEAVEDRQARKDANLARAVELGAALKILRGEA